MTRRTARPPAQPPAMPIALREITDNLTFTDTQVTAWYVLQPRHWSMQPADAQQDAIISAAAAWAGLVGHRIHLRITSRPHQPAVAAWARALAANTPNPLPAPRDVSWAATLGDTQRHIQRSTAPEKVVYLGVDVMARSSFARLTDRVLSRTGNRELAAVTKKLTALDRVAAAMDARRATVTEMEWLLHRSVGLGLNGPIRLSPATGSRWEPGDLDEFTDRVTLTARPTGRVVRVTDRHADVSTFVAVLTFGRMDPIPVPDVSRAPWMAASDQLGVYDWSSRLTVVGRAETGKRFGKNQLRIRDQERQYYEHDLPVPPEIAAKVTATARILYDTTEGTDAEAIRVIGQHRIAVTGQSEEACMDQVSALQEIYGRRNMTLVLPKGQLRLVQEFTPGARRATGDRAYRRELPAVYLAAGMPTATSILGDNRGPYLGYTGAHSRRAVHFDPHHATEVLQKSGLIPVVGVQGSGKSSLVGRIAYNAAAAGVTSTILDPSGPLAALTQMPELAPHSQHIDLMSAPAGTLSPYTVIPDPPDWTEFLTDPDLAGIVESDDRARQAYQRWEEAAFEAAAERRALAEDILRLLLPVKQIDNPLTEPVLAQALRDVGGSADKSLWDVIAQFERMAADPTRSYAEHAGILAMLANDIAEGLHGRLFFPPRNQPSPALSHAAPTLLVITMSGIQLPDRAAPQSTWTTLQRISVPLLHLAAYYATARVYGRGRHERKLVALDEVGLMAAWPSGKALFGRLGRDTRKWNIAALVASQDPYDILGLDVANHVSTAFVGRIEDDQHITDALRLLRLPARAGFEAVIRGLSPEATRERAPSRRFVMKDSAGRQGVVVVDLLGNPRLLAALDTNADPSRAPTRTRTAAGAGGVPA